MSEEWKERTKKAGEEGLRELEEKKEAVAQKIIQQIEEEKERDLKHGRRRLNP